MAIMTSTIMTFAVLLPMFCGISSAVECPAFTTEKNFDIERYTGVWYEIFRLANSTIRTVRCTNATYTLNPNGSAILVNQGLTANGSLSTATALLITLDPNVPGQLGVVFPSGAIEPYSVLETDYHDYASVFTCRIVNSTNTKREFASILSRDKSIKPNKLEKALEAFANIGIDFTRFISLPQDC